MAAERLSVTPLSTAGSAGSAGAARTARTAKAAASLAALHPEHLKSISVAAVFFGAMTYIGNGPNFLVKSIAERAKVRTPHFFGYIARDSVPILLPILAIVWWGFFR